MDSFTQSLIEPTFCISASIVIFSQLNTVNQFNFAARNFLGLQMQGLFRTIKVHGKSWNFYLRISQNAAD